MPSNPAPETYEDGSAREIIGQLIGRIPSGLFVLTAAGGDGQETGMLASWVQQASFDPPLVSVAVNGRRYLNAWLTPDSPLVLNLLGESQMDLLKHFARGFEPGEPAFEGIETRRSRTGLHVLTSALGYLEGRVVNRVEAGDHVLYLMEVVDGGAGDSLPDEQPKVHIRKNGFSY